MSAKRSSAPEFPDYGATPPHNWERTSTGGSLRWWPTRDTTKIALFRAVTDDGVAILQHIRTIHTSQRAPSRAFLDDEPELADVPKPFRRVIEADGLTLATEAGR